jgi:hypothetical protein
MQFINPFLEEILLENAMNQLSCSSDWEYSKGSDIETDIHFQYLDRNLFSFSIFQSWFCGGFHPDFGKTSYLLDLTNGKIIHWKIYSALILRVLLKRNQIPMLFPPIVRIT